MGVFDSYAIVLILISLSFVGWMSEFLLYMGKETIFEINEPFYYQMLETFKPFIDFLRSSYYVLVMALVLVNFLQNSLSTTDPVYLGVYAVLTFVVVWFLSQVIIPSVVETFLDLHVEGVHQDWWYMLADNWYLAAISGVVGAAIGYIKGAHAKRYGVMF